MHFRKPSKSIVKISTNPDDIYDFWSMPAQEQFSFQGRRSLLRSLSQTCLIRVATLIDFKLSSIRVATLSAQLQGFIFVRALFGLGFIVFALLGLGFMVLGPFTVRVHGLACFWR